MSSQSGHNRSRKSEAEEEEDPLDRLISRTGCAALHYAVQDCMAEHQDWRRCQEQVRHFRECMKEQQKQRAEELQRVQRLRHPQAD